MRVRVRDVVGCSEALHLHCDCENTYMHFIQAMDEVICIRTYACIFGFSSGSQLWGGAGGARARISHFG